MGPPLSKKLFPVGHLIAELLPMPHFPKPARNLLYTNFKKFVLKRLKKVLN